jgi:hypothetical protein
MLSKVIYTIDPVLASSRDDGTLLLCLLTTHYTKYKWNKK